MEIWKVVNGFPNYEISNFGRVRNLTTNTVKKNTLSNTGYYVTYLYNEGKRKDILIHRLIATHFIPKVYGKNNINHIDGNKKNNKVDNLEWCTQSENLKHAYRIGLVDKVKTDKNIKRLTEMKKKKVICLNNGKVYESSKEAAIDVGIASSTICRALKGVRNGAGKDSLGNLLRWEYL